MAEFSKRGEVTISTMGAVHNPSGEGVAAVSTIARAKATKVAAAANPSAVPRSRGNSLGEPPLDSTKPVREKQRKKNPFANESLHKKQGGVGKARWNDDNPNKDDIAPLDRNDPNYDSEVEDDRYVLVSGDTTADGFLSSPPRHSYDPELKRVIYGPKLTLTEFKVQVQTALEELYSSGDIAECMRIIGDLDCKDFNFEIVKRSVISSFDRGDRERELVSKFLSTSYPTLITTDDVGKGFERLFENLAEYHLDCPSAPSYLTSFLSRAVVDELLPPSFLTDPLVQSLGGYVVQDAIRALSREHSSVRLEKVWGPGDGRPVAELKVAMDQLLKEYLLSRELDEALQCVSEINAPHFHHELVKRGVKIALDSTTPPTDVDAMAHLFKFLNINDVLSKVQLKKGFDRCYSLLADFSLDNPNAPAYMTAFVEKAIGDKCLDEYTAP